MYRGRGLLEFRVPGIFFFPTPDNRYQKIEYIKIYYMNISVLRRFLSYFIRQVPIVYRLIDVALIKMFLVVFFILQYKY